MRPLPLLVCLLLGSWLVACAADPVAELGSFSVFQNVDLNKLKGDVLTARGPAMSVGRDLSAQSCYVVPGTPAQALAALQGWDASRHRELKIYVHGDLPASPVPASFAKLGSAPGNGSVKSLASKTLQVSKDLQIDNEEAKGLSSSFAGSGALFGGAIQTFWAGVLSGRAQKFTSGGTVAQSGYDHTGQDVKPGEEIASLLRQQEKVRRQFAGFLSESGALGGRGSLKKDLYFELIDVDDEGALTLGSFSSKGVGSGFQAADMTYYSSGGYYAGITLYQMWPVDVGGQPCTLVWRGDMVSAASLGALRGVEKLASEGAMMKDISRAVRLLKGDMGK